MKNVLSLIITALMLFRIPCAAAAEDNNLIRKMQTSLKNAETPKRFEVSFDLMEPIDLSQGNSNIILAYFTTDDNGSFVEIYRKDKSWSGYINSYENYPSGAQKYSSGAENAAYPDSVKATTIYSSTKTGPKIDVESITAVQITVLRADGSGEKVTIYNNGTVSAIEKITVPISDVSPSTGIILQSTTAQIPSDTVLIAEKLTSGSVYESVNASLDRVKDFIVYDVSLESQGLLIQPDGKVEISIPIPEDFTISYVAVYHIDNEIRNVYPVTITEKDGIDYATFETEHFSIYALIELEETDEADETDENMVEEELENIAETENVAEDLILADEENPQTGKSQLIYYAFILFLISVVGFIVLTKQHRLKSR